MAARQGRLLGVLCPSEMRHLVSVGPRRCRVANGRPSVSHSSPSAILKSPTPQGLLGQSTRPANTYKRLFHRCKTSTAPGPLAGGWKGTHVCTRRTPCSLRQAGIVCVTMLDRFVHTGPCGTGSQPGRLDIQARKARLLVFVLTSYVPERHKHSRNPRTHGLQGLCHRDGLACPPQSSASRLRHGSAMHSAAMRFRWLACLVLAVFEAVTGTGAVPCSTGAIS